MSEEAEAFDIQEGQMTVQLDDLRERMNIVEAQCTVESDNLNMQMKKTQADIQEGRDTISQLEVSKVTWRERCHVLRQEAREMEEDAENRIRSAKRLQQRAIDAKLNADQLQKKADNERQIVTEQMADTALKKATLEEETESVAREIVRINERYDTIGEKCTIAHNRILEHMEYMKNNDELSRQQRLLELQELSNLQLQYSKETEIHEVSAAGTNKCKKARINNLEVLSEAALHPSG